MRPVRVLFGAMPTPLHAALSEVIRGQTDVEVVGVASRPASLLVAAGTLAADVVVVATVDGGLPGIASHLFDQYPQIWIVAVAPDGQHALVCAMRQYLEHIAFSTPADLVTAIGSWGDQLDD
jgi:DNA-binding NarL/FixJ family response regulator